MEEEEEDDGLGFYPDGTKRTLTDAQIAMFRHSEIQAALRARRVKAERDAERGSERGNDTGGESEDEEEEYRRFLRREREELGMGAGTGGGLDYGDGDGEEGKEEEGVGVGVAEEGTVGKAEGEGEAPKGTWMERRRIVYDDVEMGDPPQPAPQPAKKGFQWPVIRREGP